jgi:hypothetical protein
MWTKLWRKEYITLADKQQLSDCFGLWTRCKLVAKEGAGAGGSSSKNNKSTSM